MRSTSMRFAVLPAVALLALSLAACGPDTEEERNDPVQGSCGGDGSILFGQGINCVRLGTSFATVVATLGEGDAGTDGWLRYRDRGLNFVPDSEDKPFEQRVVRSMFVKAPFNGSTEQGIRIGTSRAESRSLLGTPPEEDEDSDKYSCKGVWLHFDAQDELERFQIFEPFGC